ncbi:hypothetical protein [Dactylosporangium sp. CA-139066]|uniref:hypothetical protein n=1 Tax=Dactylosporangium sp. CA-139066 TaxID=3239930 RepID=UPI003D8EE2E3
MEENNGGPRPFRDRADLHRILVLVLDLLRTAGPAGCDYRLAGTAAALAQGVPLRAGDIDILMATRPDVDRFATALSAHRCLVPPNWLAAASQYYASFEVEGFKVEASTVEYAAAGDTFECAGTGPWKHFVELPVAHHVVPAVRLELRLVTELVRDRPDRYEPLLAYLSSRDPDVALIERAMRDREVAAELRRLVAARLASA